MKKSNLVIKVSNGGGKAGTGRNKTATIQVRDPMPGGYLLLKSYRYTVGDKQSLLKATRKALTFASQHP